MTIELPKFGQQASGLPPMDLSSAFGAPPADLATAPGRAEGIPRLQRPTSSHTAPPPPLTSVPASPSSTATTMSPPRKGAKKKHPSSVVVYLGTSLRARLRAEQAQSGRSYTVLTFAALNAHRHELAKLTAVTPARTVEPAMDGLFEVQTSGRLVHNEDQVQVSIRPNPHNLTVIDELAKTYTGGNRSALIAATLDAYLP